MHKVQHDGQLWNDLLFVSGGKLELSKCSYHALRFQFAADGSPSADTTTPPSINIVDSVTNQAITVRPLPPYEPHKTLGHWKAPAGTAKTQLSMISNKVKIISIRISTSWLSRTGARLAYHAIYAAILTYVLPQCHFLSDALRKSEKKSMPNLYAKCGFSRKTPQALLFAPREYGGGGFLHWDIIQGEGQILHFLKHWRTESTISTTLRINLAWCQWQAGTSLSILQHTDPEDLKYLEARWLPSLRKALHQFGAKIIVDHDHVPCRERGDDRYIMDIASQSMLFDDKTLQIINYCRLYLHITTISEMFDTTGVTIQTHVLKCERPPWFDPSVNVTIQRRPSNHQIRTRWKALCELVSSWSTTGPWILPLRLRRETYCQITHESSTTTSPGNQYYHWYAGSYWVCTSPQRAHTMQ
jgi:hypothetical protein